MEIKEYTLGEGKLVYVPRWATDPEMLFREAKKLSFTPEIVPSYGKAVTIKKRKTVDYGLEYSYSKTQNARLDGSLLLWR